MKSKLIKNRLMKKTTLVILTSFFINCFFINDGFAKTDVSCKLFAASPILKITNEEIKFDRMELIYLPKYWGKGAQILPALYIQLPKHLTNNKDLKIEIKRINHNQKPQGSSHKLEKSTDFKDKENLFFISLDFQKKYLSQITSYQGHIIFRLKNKSETLCDYKMEIGVIE